MKSLSFIKKSVMNNRLYTVVALACLLGACTKYETPPPTKGDVEQEEIKLIFDRKVLWINIDGAVGAVVEDVMPTNIAAMLPNSKYTFNGLSEMTTPENRFTEYEDPVNWATMLTGVVPEKHKIDGYTYKPEMAPDIDNQTETMTYFSTALDYIKGTYPKEKVICITPWINLNTNMLANSYSTVTSPDDATTLEKALETVGNEDCMLMLLSFRGMLDAGRAGGFTKQNTDYVNALNVIDGYIGQLCAAIEQRETCEDEDWLIVITSTHGGDAAGNTYGDAARNSFGIFYFAHYAETYRMQGESLYAAFFELKNGAYAIDTLQLFSMGFDKRLSVELIMRMHPKSNSTYTGNNWDRVIGKDKWTVNRQRLTLGTYITPVSGSVMQEGVTGFNDPIWHSYIFGTQHTSPTTKDFAIYFDGVKDKYGSRTTVGIAKDTSELWIGDSSIPTTFDMAEIRIWDTLLSDADAAELSSMLKISPTHPLYKHLVSYWIFDPNDPKTYIDADTAYILNQIPDREPLHFKQPPVFVRAANTLPAHRDSDQMFESTLVLPQILYWLQVSVPSAIDGVLFLDNYIKDELWRDQIDAE